MVQNCAAGSVFHGNFCLISCNANLPIKRPDFNAVLYKTKYKLWFVDTQRIFTVLL